MLEYVKEYIQTLSVSDKKGYEKRITACVEYLDGIGVTEPTESNWQSCLEHLTADGKINETTARTNYIGQAKKFYSWYVNKDMQSALDESAKDGSEGEMPKTALAMTDEIEPNKEETHSDKPSNKTKDKPVRINFMLDEKRYKKLAILSILENTSLTALLKEGIDLCISAHDKQAAIAEQAVSQSENARSE